MIPTDLNDEFCNILCAWQALEDSFKDGGTIVDFNLIRWEGDSRTYKNRNEVLKELENFLSDPRTRTDRLFFQRVYGLRAYIKDVLNNQTTPFDEYLQATMGMKLSYLPDDFMNDLKQRIVSRLKSLEIHFPKSKKELAEKTKVIAVDDIPDWFNKQYGANMEKAVSIFGTPPNIPKPIVTIFESESLTRARIFGQGRQFHLEFNRKRVSENSETELKSTNNHEILGHAVNCATLLDEIERKNIDPHYGLTCMQGFEAFQMEGVAESAARYFGDLDDPFYRANIELGYYERQVTSNFIWLCTRPDADIDAAIDYHKEMTPYRDEEFIGQKLKTFNGNNSLYKAYYPVYAPAMRLFFHVMDHLDAEKQNIFMQKTYKRPMDPLDLYQLALSMGVPALEHFEPARSPMVESIERCLSQRSNSFSKLQA